MKFIPHPYQMRAMEFLVQNAEAGLFLSPGLGKTSITLGAFKALRRAGFVDKMLVIAPLRPCYAVWPREVTKWDEFNQFSVGILHGSKKEKILREEHDIYVINPEGLNWLFRTLKKPYPFEMLVIDESSRFKHTNTQRFKTLKPHLPKFKRRYILTGSPAANSLMDVFGQIYCMDLGKTFGEYITHFRNQYFYQTGYEGYNWQLIKGAEQQIYDRLAPRVMRMSAKDYLDLPPLIVEDIEIVLPDKVMTIYKQMEEALRLDFKSGRVVAANAGVALMKCRQIANGGLYLDSGESQLIHMEKANVVEELVEELEGQPALIAYEFKHDLERLKKVFGKDTPHIGGGVSGKSSNAILNDWNAGRLSVLLGQPQSMAHGLNMQEAGKAVIFHSMIWNLEDYDQFIQRVWRQGQKEKVFVYRIIAKDTIDEVVVKALARKEKDQEALFAALKNYWG